MSYDGENPHYNSIDLSGSVSPPSNANSGTVFYSTASGLVGYDGSTWGKLDVVSLSGLIDVDFSAGISANDVLMYDGSNWIASGVPVNLSDLNDVTGSPSSGDYLGYNGANWIPTTITPGPQSISGLNDVDITSVSDGDYLVYNSASGSFLNETSNKALDDLSDVTITSPAASSVLQYNGSAWIDSTDTIGTGDSFMTLVATNDATGGGYVSGVTVSGSLNTHNHWFFIATEVETYTVTRNIHFRFANAGTDRSTLYDNSYRRRIATSSTDTNAATTNDTGVDCGGGINWTNEERGQIMGWLTRYADGTYGKWMGRILTQVAGGFYYTENIFNWDADQEIDSLRIYSTISTSTTENGTIKAKISLYKVGA